MRVVLRSRREQESTDVGVITLSEGKLVSVPEGRAEELAKHYRLGRSSPKEFLRELPNVVRGPYLYAVLEDDNKS